MAFGTPIHTPKNDLIHGHPVTPKLRSSIRPVFFFGRGEANIDP